MAASARVGSGHRAGGADRASGVDTAGTVARIDLRFCCTTPSKVSNFTYHPDCEVASADSSTTSARIVLWYVFNFTIPRSQCGVISSVS